MSSSSDHKTDEPTSDQIKAAEVNLTAWLHKTFEKYNELVEGDIVCHLKKLETGEAVNIEVDETTGMPKLDDKGIVITKPVAMTLYEVFIVTDMNKFMDIMEAESKNYQDLDPESHPLNLVAVKWKELLSGMEKELGIDANEKEATILNIFDDEVNAELGGPHDEKLNLECNILNEHVLFLASPKFFQLANRPPEAPPAPFPQVNTQKTKPVLGDLFSPSNKPSHATDSQNDDLDQANKNKGDSKHGHGR